MPSASHWIIAAVCAAGLSSLAGAEPAATTAALPGGGQAMSASLQPFPVYSGRAGRKGHYVPSGYMGDLAALNMSGGYVPTHDGSGTPLKVTYTGKGKKGWAGVYWQNPANNWGERPGKAGYDLTGAKRLTFWARGENGGEKIREVKVGGIVGRYPDSDVARKGPIVLTRDWTQYVIDLDGKDLKHIIGGFGFTMNKYDNAGAVTFYLDDIAYVLPFGSPAIAPEPVLADTPKPMPVPESPSKDIEIKAEEAGLRVTVSNHFLFDSGRSRLKPESDRLLKQVAKLLTAYPRNKALVEGHSDSVGAADFNLNLSRKRAEHVRNYFVQKAGLEESRFEVVGYGETRPVADNATTRGRALNRRVEVIILKTSDQSSPQDPPAPPAQREETK